MRTFQEYLREANAKAVLIAVPKHPTQGDGRGFWKIGNDVYRASVKGQMDTYGLPMDKRWESSYEHFARYWQTVHSQFYTKTKEWK
ncbi:MAG: hypothetical protein ACO36I_25615 [Candidatus Latescibacterota bacterium]